MQLKGKELKITFYFVFEEDVSERQISSNLDCPIFAKKGSTNKRTKEKQAVEDNVMDYTLDKKALNGFKLAQDVFLKDKQNRQSNYTIKARIPIKQKGNQLVRVK